VFLGKNKPYKNYITEKIEELMCERANKQENWEVRHTQKNKGDTKTIKKVEGIDQPIQTTIIIGAKHV
jgi:hypothetical protein